MMLCTFFFSFLFSLLFFPILRSIEITRTVVIKIERIKSNDVKKKKTIEKAKVYPRIYLIFEPGPTIINTLPSLLHFRPDVPTSFSFSPWPIRPSRHYSLH